MGHATGFVIAVVDDDRRVLESLQDLLEAAGHTVRLFSSAATLLEMDRLSGVDCLISDIGMPVIDGFELRRQATRARPGLPVILITGRHEIQPEDRPGASYQSFFRKPFNGEDLLTAVSDALRAPDDV